LILERLEAGERLLLSSKRLVTSLSRIDQVVRMKYIFTTKLSSYYYYKKPSLSCFRRLGRSIALKEKVALAVQCSAVN
jgi:hypothetical protein